MSPHDAPSAALAALLARHADLVRRVGWRHGLSDADVDDVFQDVRIRLWHARSESEKISDLGASYVYRTAAAAAIDLIRRRRAKREDDLEVTNESATVRDALSTASLEEGVESSEAVEQVMRAVDELAPARRPVVRMYLAGYQREEIAQLMGWTEAKTRNLLYRGLADLRELLTTRGIGPEVAR